MNFSLNSDYQYQPGGSLAPDAPTYVVREADHQLYNALLARQYCYVLNARQMGKSSLRIHTMRKLEAQGIACAEVELSGIGSQQITSKQWYGGIIQELISGFEISLNRRRWFEEHEDLYPVQRLGKFIETVLLTQIEQPLVIFIDEIDSVLSLDFPTDEFFALIRNCYDKRATNPQYQRLSFVLLGVATPSDLIQDPKSTPFNIGQAIDLKGFQLHESDSLVTGLQAKTINPKSLLQEILYWSGGQPFLTQKLCWLVAKSETIITQGEEKKWVKRLVYEQILKNWESQDEPEHLRTIRDRLLRNSHSSKKLLKLYQQILKRGQIAFREDIAYMELRLSGLVMIYQSNLVVKNPIYREVFNKNWLTQQLKRLKTPQKYPSLWSVLVIGIIMSLGVIGIRLLGILQGLELTAYDQLLRLLPPEKPDSRLLIVGADETDLGLYGHPIPDHILAQVLDKIQQKQPAAIGLDIVRDQPVPPGHQQLISHFQQNSSLIAGCAFGGQDNSQSIKPPPTIPLERLGFIDLYPDMTQYENQDYTVRRYLLSRSPNSDSSDSVCPSSLSFAWYLAFLYFQKQGINVTTVGDNWQFGDLIVKRLQPYSGGYQGLDNRGNQLLIRYRHTTNPDQIAPQVKFRDIVNNTANFSTDLVKDRIVLIGVVAASVPDPHDTPYGRIRGLSVHAHSVSQLVSAVEPERRSLINWLSWWEDGILVLSCALISGLIIWRLRIYFAQGIGLILCIIVVYGICWLGLNQGLWLPLVPSLLGIVATGIGIITYQIWLGRSKKISIRTMTNEQ